MNIWGNNFLSQQVFPGKYANVANKIISSHAEKVKEATVDNFDKNNIDNLLTQIKTDISDQGDRKKGLEDKVKAILFSISVSITAITFSLTYGKNNIGNIIDITAVFLLLSSIIYFISSAIISVKTLQPIPFQLVQTESNYDSELNKIEIVNQDKNEQYKELVIAKWLNDSSNLQIANFTYAALKCLRNGMILFSIYFIVALAQKNFSGLLLDKNIVSNNVKIQINDSTSINLPYSYQVDATNNMLKIGKPEINIKKYKAVKK